MGANPIAIPSTAPLPYSQTTASGPPRLDLPRATVPALLFLLGLAACRAPSRAETGHLELHWNGPQAGSIAGPTSAGWCALRKVLQVRVIQGDTGIALAVYPGKALEGGVYPVVDPVKAESVPPAASVALRVVTKNLVQGFRGDSGRVNLESSRSRRFSGSVSARARSVIDTQ